MHQKLRFAVSTIFLFLLFGIAHPRAVFAAVTYYTDTSTFSSTVPGLPTEDFEEGGVGDNAIISCGSPINSSTNNDCFSTGEVTPGVTFQDNPDIRTNDGIAMSGAAYNGEGNTSKILIANYFVDTLDITFSGTGVHAVGMTLFSLWNDSTIDITVYSAGNAVLSTTTASVDNDGTFWGVTSDTPITKINLSSQTAQAEGVDDISFGEVSPTVTLTTVGERTGTTTKVMGSASVSYGTISNVEYQVGKTGGTWSSCIADDGAYDESPETFTCTLPSLLEETNIVYVRATNNITATTTGSGTDTIGPAGKFVINPSNGKISGNQARYTSDRHVSLSLAAGDNMSEVTQMRVSGKKDFRDVDWRPYEKEIEFDLGDEEGTNYVYVQYKDSAGNKSETYKESIKLDQTGPDFSLESVGGVLFESNNGSTYYFMSGRLDFSGTASNKSKIKMRIDGSKHSTAPRLKEGETSWSINDVTLSEGTHEIEIYAKDHAENVSNKITLTVVVDVSGGSLPESLKEVLGLNDAVDNISVTEEVENTEDIEISFLVSPEVLESMTHEISGSSEGSPDKVIFSVIQKYVSALPFPRRLSLM